jgi:hypothetical protein
MCDGELDAGPMIGEDCFLRGCADEWWVRVACSVNWIDGGGPLCG